MRLVEHPSERETRERWDVLLSALFLSLGITGLLLLQNPALWTRLIGAGAQGTIVGRLTKQDGSVRVRSKKSLVWRDTSDGQITPVAGGDSIFTGPDGDVELTFNSGLTLKILPNSLVIVPSDEKAPVLNVVEGSVQLDRQSPLQQLSLNVKGSLYELKAGETATIDLTGNATVSKSAAQSSAKLNPPSLLSPLEGARIVLGKGREKQPVIFTWKNGFPNLETTVEVRARGSNQILQHKSSATEGLSQELGAGEYQWRVWSRSKKGATSDPSSWRGFSVLKDYQTRMSEEADRRAAKQAQEEAARRQAAEEAARKKAAEEEARRQALARKAQEDAARRQAAAEARRREFERRAQEEAARRRADEEALKRATIHRNPKQEVIPEGDDPLLYP